MTSFFDAARGTAHSLNNVVGILYAASDYLEGPVDERSLERARKAIARAGASIQALAAALALLGLEPDDIKAAATRRPGALDADDLERIFDSLRAVCDASCTGVRESWLPVPILIDRDTLQSILVCAGSFVLYTGAGSVALRCTVRCVFDASGNVGEIIFEIGSETRVSAAPGVPEKAARHPCALALAHVSPMLMELGVAIETVDPTMWRVTVGVATAG